MQTDASRYLRPARATPQGHDSRNAVVVFQDRRPRSILDLMREAVRALLCGLRNAVMMYLCMLGMHPTSVPARQWLGPYIL